MRSEAQCGKLTDTSLKRHMTEILRNAAIVKVIVSQGVNKVFSAYSPTQCVFISQYHHSFESHALCGKKCVKTSLSVHEEITWSYYNELK